MTKKAMVQYFLFKRPVVKSHGGIDANGFYHSINLCYRLLNDLNVKLKII